MTQLSPYTVAYDQIARAVATLAEKWSKGDYVTKQDAVEDFNQSLNELYSSIGSTKTKVEQFIKGEPPSSQKINSFFNGFKEDINLAAKQLDYLSSKVVNIYNLLNSEIESEKKYSQRILSKAKILQIYSQSPADDIVYIGDSFDNQDFIDVKNHIIGKIPLVENSQLTLQPTKRSDWNATSITINPSNGFIGNNHAVVRALGDIDSNNYRYVFEDSASVSNKNNILDKNPLTYFEYEAIHVEDDPNFKKLDHEFSYIIDDVSIINKNYKINELINWSNHDLSDPLVLDFTLVAPAAEKANSITIMPYFASSKLIKVSSIILEIKDGSQKEILSKPIYIGASPNNLTTKSFGSYFIDKAVIQFEEAEVIKARIKIEQDQFQDIDIQHIYWDTNYAEGQRDDSPFSGKNRFNPFEFNTQVYSEVKFDFSKIIPTLTNPNYFKIKNLQEQNIKINTVKLSTNSSPSSSITYTVPIKMKKKILKAKRMAIGLRDVSLQYNEYLNTAQIVSKPFNFDLPVESLILNIESDFNSVNETSSTINSYVSVDEGKNWLRISPIQYGYQNGDEVLAFNQNVPSGYKLPGVTYYSYPDVPKEIKNVIVKIEINKSQTVNKTPVLYSYTLGAKVKKS